MRVLFDHNLPHKLRTSLGALGTHEIITTSYTVWTGLKNGELLRAAEQSAFDVFVTGDKSPIYEQNLTGRHLAVVALSVNNWPIIKERISEIFAGIDNASPASFQAVECGNSPASGRATACRNSPSLGFCKIARSLNWMAAAKYIRWQLGP